MIDDEDASRGAVVEATAGVTSSSDVLARLSQWIEEARWSGAKTPAAASLATVDTVGQPSSRMVTIKRVESDHLIFTSALWTRKAQDLGLNKRTSLLFYWPELGRQVHLAGTAEPAPRPLAEALFRERELSHQIQTHVSRQGQPIKDLAPLRHVAENLYHRLTAPQPWPSANDHASRIDGAELTCPADWGAYRIVPTAIEFWVEAADRLHLRMLYEQQAGQRWRVRQLAP